MMGMIRPILMFLCMVIYTYQAHCTCSLASPFKARPVFALLCMVISYLIIRYFLPVHWCGVCIEGTACSNACVLAVIIYLIISYVLPVHWRDICMQGTTCSQACIHDYRKYFFLCTRHVLLFLCSGVYVCVRDYRKFLSLH